MKVDETQQFKWGCIIQALILYQFWAWDIDFVCTCLIRSVSKDISSANVALESKGHVLH